jgi:2-C-methyl-D-erythritol 4-phosphate cytidylyltransferase/2-C-methyl-D-erythritol 2,4-cyclodiphosphate synthase
MPEFNRALIVVAAGRGSRAGDGLPKQYRPLAGRPVLAYTLAAVLNEPIDRVLPVIHRDDAALYGTIAQALPDHLTSRLLAPVMGGNTRQQSVLNGLEALADDPPDLVAIHDGARPLLGAANRLIEVAFVAAARYGAAIPGYRLSDTIKQVDGDDKTICGVDREALRAVQTPQAFRFALLLQAHRQAAGANRQSFTDDAAVLAWASGHPSHVFESSSDNLKITTADDFIRAEQLLLGRLLDIRVGQGFDVHAFEPGDHVWLGGVRIGHDKALTGHSDADVVLHALTDAILGALSDADIGAHFPPSDPQYRHAASHLFLRDAVQRVNRRGGILAHLDATVICESPRIGPYRDEMRQTIARIAGVSIDRVAVKATTSERLGFTGRGEGIAVMATATVRLPLAATGNGSADS